MTLRGEVERGESRAAFTIVLDDYSLQAVRGLDEDLARAGALVMRSFKGLPAPHLLRRFHGAAVVGGPDRTGLLARLERATATVPAPVIAILPEGVAPEAALRGPGVVDLIPARSQNVARRILLMAHVPIVGAQRGCGTGASPGTRRQGRDPEPNAAAAAEARRTAVVAVASSTGGVWVLAAMLRDLPTAGRAVVVAQHMEAEFVPSFAGWLMSDSGWRVVVVDGVAALAEGTAYVPAGGRDLVVDDLVVRALPPSGRFMPSADRLLTSVAAVGPRATGVVLSGMGTDGTQGLAAIAERGGRVFCQAPHSAVVPSMPQSALARTRAAVAVAPDRLAAAISANA
jgi:two-component system chemotaxis response regulator CheB